jgi:ubiquitin C-terminal hydrolase
MKREGRPTVKEEDEEPNEKLTEEELAKKKELEDEFRHPEEDDCYEYKLVGVNVHSGTAQAGHYWSYINTNRGTDEEENDPTWMQTENDPWMEFNDAHVTDYKFNKLDEDVSGDASIKLSSGYDPYGYSSTSSWGGSYGKSAYMLFYERRKKKDLKFVV